MKITTVTCLTVSLICLYYFTLEELFLIPLAILWNKTDWIYFSFFSLPFVIFSLAVCQFLIQHLLSACALTKVTNNHSVYDLSTWFLPVLSMLNLIPCNSWCYYIIITNLISRFADLLPYFSSILKSGNTATRKFMIWNLWSSSLFRNTLGKLSSFSCERLYSVWFEVIAHTLSLIVWRFSSPSLLKGVVFDWYSASILVEICPTCFVSKTNLHHLSRIYWLLSHFQSLKWRCCTCVP